MQRHLDQQSFWKTYVYPAMIVFAIPTLSLFFFTHAQSNYDGRARSSMISAIHGNPKIPEAERQELMAFFRDVPLSRVLGGTDPDLEPLRQSVSAETKFYFATFRWMIRLAIACLLAGVFLFGLLGVTVWFSQRSQRALYLSLSTGWHAMRIFATAEVLAQAVLLFALSFWITALWFDFYSLRLVAGVGILAFVAVIPVMAAIFAPIDNQLVVRGHMLHPASAPRLWDRLESVNKDIGSTLPDQVVVGIDDNFFVTEHTVTVNEVAYSGRTLFVSLPLLKTLDGVEADAVLAHELAHFSGKDTYYSRKITPLLARYHHYLAGPNAGGIVARPVFYCAMLFWALYHLALGNQSRQREFIADQVAADCTTAASVVSSLVRVTAYSAFRRTVEQEFFQANQAHEMVNISQRIGEGFEDFARHFLDDADALDSSAPHPFDSHPPLFQRLQALQADFCVDNLKSMLSSKGDGAWLECIDRAQEIESTQWSEFESQFRDAHEISLIFRYLPSNDEERAFLEQYFPEQKLTVRKSKIVTIDCEKVVYEEWDSPLYFHEITYMALAREWGVPMIQFTINRNGRRMMELPISDNAVEQQAVIEALQKYSARYATAAAQQAGSAVNEPGSAEMQLQNVDGNG